MSVTGESRLFSHVQDAAEVQTDRQSCLEDLLFLEYVNLWLTLA